MRKIDITPRECLLWLALVAAIGGTLFAVLRGSDSPPLSTGGASVAQRPNTRPAPATRIPSTRSMFRTREAEPVEAVDPLANSPMESTRGIENTSNDKSGFEMPFAPDMEKADRAESLGSDPATLCKALQDALQAGDGANLAAIRTRILEVGSAAVPTVSALLHCGDSRAEIEAVRLLVQLGDGEALALALGRVLTVPRDAAAYGLFLAAFADNGSPGVAQWLTDTLGTTQSADTRERMLDLLYAMRGPAAVAALERAALDPSDDMHAQDAVDAITLRHDPADTESLSALLASEHPGISEAAAYGLAGVGSGVACDTLADAAEGGRGRTYRPALASITSSYAQETLLALATDRDRSVTVRTAAIESLSTQSGQRVQTVLENAVQQEQSQEVAAQMETVLANLNNSQSVGTYDSPGTEGVREELWY